MIAIEGGRHKTKKKSVEGESINKGKIPVKLFAKYSSMRKF